MQWTALAVNPEAVKCDLLVISVPELKPLSHPLLALLDKKFGGNLIRLLKKEGFEGKEGASKLIYTQGRLPAENLLILGLGLGKKFEPEIARKLSARAAKVALQIKAVHVATQIHGAEFKTFSIGECAQAVAEGFGLASYQFQRYKKKDKNRREIKKITLISPSRKYLPEIAEGRSRGELLADGIFLARDLINTPAKDMTPLAMAREAKSLKGIRTRIFNESQIRRMKMGAYLGVAQGSINPPAFIEMHYRPARSRKKVVIIGKGVTFDSGGLSLKPPKHMETMKDDMSGAAAVIGLMSVIARLKPRVEVWGLVAAAENMPDARAQRPGDIVTAMNGKTIEVLNTDAEGRLTLADAVVYGRQKKPDYMIDLATLTGACLVALGDRISGIMGNDEELVDKLIEAGKKTGEKMWELPLADEYKDELKSPIADLKNVGGSYAGTINGGLFIQEFVGDTKWAHIDIAGPSWTEKPRDYEAKGGTGVMVRALAEFLSKF